MNNKSLVTLILAASVPNMGIGLKGTLPWRLSNELKYFKKVTNGGVVIMGRKTWDSIPPKFRPLPGRENIVISRSQILDLPQGVLHATSYEQAIERATELNKPIYVIGGAQIYSAALQTESTKRILLTEITKFDGHCDTFLTSFKWDEAVSGSWTKSTFERLQEVTGGAAIEGVVKENGAEYNFALWERT